MNRTRLGPGTSAEEIRALVPPASDVEDAVREILAAVRERGDDAVRELTARLDGAQVDDLRVPVEEIDAAPGQLEPAVLEALRTAVTNVSGVAEAQLRESVSLDLEQGQRVEIAELPVRRA
ncbi:MAG TPA: histidinol dehydrogenase, partial [Candidatus Dormibacteraeota bacterium]|nr:histidinol dehydrogenase [Candidatus Dormibacteraeota bacterium]